MWRNVSLSHLTQLNLLTVNKDKFMYIYYHLQIINIKPKLTKPNVN